MADKNESNVITKEWMDVYDAGMKQALQPLGDAQVIRTLQAPPDGTTLTYTIGTGAQAVTYPFKIGDEVRVPDADNASEGANGYVYYKLYDIQNGTAYWDLGGSGGSGGGALGKVKVYLKDIINDVENLSPSFAGVVVTLTNTSDAGNTPVTKTIAAGETSCVFTKVTPLKDYSVSVSALDSQHTTPAAQTITNLAIGEEKELTFRYEADEYTAVISSNQGASDEAVGSAWVRAQYTLDGQTVNSSNLTNGQTWKVPHGVTLSVSASSNVTGYSKQTGVDTTNKLLTAAYSTTKVNLQMVGVVNGTEGAYPTGAAGTVKYSGGADQVLEDNSSLALVPTGTPFTIDYAAVASYGTPAQYSATAAGTAMTAAKAAYTYGMLTVNVTNNDQDDTDLAKVKVYITIGSGSEEEVTGTIANHVKTFQKAIVPGTQYSIRYGAVEGYDTPAAVSGTMPAAGTDTLTAEYHTERLSVSLSADEGAPNLTTVTITVKNASDDSVLTTATGSLTNYKIPFGVTYKVSLSSVEGYTTPADVTKDWTDTQAKSLALMYEKITVVTDYIILDQTSNDPTKKVLDSAGRTYSNGYTRPAVIDQIRAASHCYVGTFASNKMTLKQLSDTDGTKYADGTSAASDIASTSKDVFMRLPIFYTRTTQVETDKWKIEFAFDPSQVGANGQIVSTTSAVPAGTGWKKWGGNDLIGKYEAECSDTGNNTSGTLRSRSGVQSTGNVSQANFKQKARNKGTGFTIVKWRHQCIMAMLFYAYYGHTNCQQLIGSGYSDYQGSNRATGLKDSLGMTDTTASNGNTNNIVFWGLENWWGCKYEWVDNVEVNKAIWTITEDDGTTRTVTYTPSAYGTSIYPQKYQIGDNLDTIPVSGQAAGSDSTGYCDSVYVSDSASRVVRRSSYYAYAYGGVGFAYADFDASYTYASLGSRLAFTGAIEIA